MAATPGAFGAPYGLTIDADGKIYVTDVTNRTVQRCDANGDFDALVTGPASGAGALVEPTGVAVDQNGGVYVADGTANTVTIFAPQ